MFCRSCFRLCGHKPSIIEYHVLQSFEGFFGFYEPRLDCSMDRLSLWDQDCRQEGQSDRTHSDIFFLYRLISSVLLVNCRITRPNDRWQSKCLQDPRSITVSPKRKTSDLQKRQHSGQQLVDSDAEAVVQYLSKRLVKRKTWAGTDEKKISLGRCSPSSKNTFIGPSPFLILIFSLFSNGCEGGPGQNA